MLQVCEQDYLEKADTILDWHAQRDLIIPHKLRDACRKLVKKRRIPKSLESYIDKLYENTVIKNH